MERFYIDFGNGITCTMQVKEPPAGKNHNSQFFWEGRPTPELFPTYREWVHGNNKVLAAKWNRGLIHVFQFSQDKIEAWEYQPGQEPKPTVPPMQ